MISMANKIEHRINENHTTKFSDDSLLTELKTSSKVPETEFALPYPFSFINNEIKKDSKNVMSDIPDGRLWLVNESGEVISSEGDNLLSIKWDKENLPELAHELRNLKSWLSPSHFILKLNTKNNIYLVLAEDLPYFGINYIFLILGHSILNTTMAMILALLIVFFYLRKKSKVAARVMSELESGNLKARFEIGRFDEFTSLLCDFNRMAEQIEKLVVKLRNAESARSQMIGELGHDLKTPLTSMMTNTETLVSYFDSIKTEDRKDLLFQLKSDILYFKHLIESLTEVASLDEPSYKLNTTELDLEIYLREEFKNRQTSPNISWSFEIQGNKKIIQADPHLITRLFKNAFDNSARFAKSKVNVKVSSTSNFIKLNIMDDGAGLTDIEMNLFAKRRERRKRREGSDEFSLGFGSIIMKSIVELHGGSINISNLMVENKIVGSNLEIILPINVIVHRPRERLNLPAQVN